MHRDTNIGHDTVLHIETTVILWYTISPCWQICAQQTPTQCSLYWISAINTINIGQTGIAFICTLSCLLYMESKLIVWHSQFFLVVALVLLQHSHTHYLQIPQNQTKSPTSNWQLGNNEFHPYYRRLTYK